MKITRYQDLREGDRVFTSNGPQTVAHVQQFVAWAQVTVVRQDDSEWSMQLHDSNFYRFTFERESLWTCPTCGKHRFVIHGFPLGGPMNPMGLNMGQRRVCKSCHAWYLLPAGTIDPNVTPAEEV
jgi:hypothetical protein